MPIPTEPVGSIPRPPELIEAVKKFKEGHLTQEQLDAAYENALRDTLRRLEATGSPVISDGEQTKPSFATYAVDGLPNLAPDGVLVSFADGHTRQLPRLTGGPFRYAKHAASFLEVAGKYTKVPLKQAVISASLLSLLYPQTGIEGYSREAFLADLIQEAVADIQGCLDQGAHKVQIDFTEGRLSLKLDPSGQLLKQFVDLNNQVLGHFSPAQSRRIGVHTCAGSDLDAPHSADVDYANLLPILFTLKAGNFYIQLASENDRRHVLQLIRDCMRPGQTIFVGVINPMSSQVERPEEVRDHVLEASEFIPLQQLGTTDDCGFSPFSDDTSTGREVAFEKIHARVMGTELAAQKLGL